MCQILDYMFNNANMCWLLIKDFSLTGSKFVSTPCLKIVRLMIITHLYWMSQIPIVDLFVIYFTLASLTPLNNLASLLNHPHSSIGLLQSMFSRIWSIHHLQPSLCLFIIHWDCKLFVMLIGSLVLLVTYLSLVIVFL